MLQSARCIDFHRADVRRQARDVLTDAGVDGLIVIGGNGSLTGALHLSDPAEAGDWPVRVIGIPASIDNDIALTSLSIGVDTAMNTIVEACDKIADTASAHDRVFLVEVMGRECGYLAMTSAIASGADMVMFPEADRTDAELVDGVVDAVLAVRARGGSQKVIAIKAEGIETRSDRLKELIDEQLQRRTGAAGGRHRDPRHRARTRCSRRSTECLRSIARKPHGQRGRSITASTERTDRWLHGNLRWTRWTARRAIDHTIRTAT